MKRARPADRPAREERQEGKRIEAFSGPYFFLSNFYPHPVEIDGLIYPTNEHAFQALKSLDPEERERVRAAASPGAAKRAGRQVNLRPDWNQ